MQNSQIRLSRARRRQRRRKAHIVSRTLLTLVALLILLPVFLTALYSFFSPQEIQAFMETRGNYDAQAWMDIKLAPQVFSLSQYYNILVEDASVLRLLVNSAMYTGAILFGQALVIPAMAYALSRFRFPGRDAIFFVVIMLMLLPFQVTMVPNVLTLRALGLLNTAWAVILPTCFAPFYIFLVRQFMVGLPQEVIEAAQIDGAGTFRLYTRIVFPMLKPTSTVVLLMSLVNSFKVFDSIWVMTKGGPYRSSETLALTMYQETFIRNNLGLGAAVAIVLTIIIMFVSYFNIRNTFRSERNR